MKKVQVGQVRDLLGKKIAVIHKWGEDQFMIAPLSKKQVRPDQWKTSRGQVINFGLTASESTKWLLAHSKVINAITKEDADACWYLFCDSLEGTKAEPKYLTVESINRRLINDWPKETPQNLAKAKREWQSFMAVTSPMPA
jgi:hypothetical protein